MAVPQGLYAWDWVIFVAMLMGTLGIGLYHAFAGGRQKTTAEYLYGNRQLHCFPVSISLTASFFSSILMLGFPAEAYTNGGQYWIYAVGIALGSLLACIIFVPVFHPLQLTSVNDYLRQRYHSRIVAVLGSLSVVAGMLLYTSIVYFAPATAFEKVTGFPTWASIIIGSAITIIYTSIGGIKAVIWTDVFQAFLMLVGLLTISITAITRVGSISEVWEICGQWDRLNIIDTSSDVTQRFTFWSLTIGVAFFDMNRYGCQQTAIQRYCSLPTLFQARLCVLGLVPWTTVLTFLASLSGLTVFAYYTKQGCDPLEADLINNANQLIPHFVAETLNYPGIQGILLASLVSASLSTASSALNSSAANVWKDIFCLIWPQLSERKNVLVTKLLVVVFGVVSTGLAFVFINLGGTVVQMVVTFFSACGGPTTAMFLLGIFFPFTNWIGATAGGVSGFIFALWMGFGSYSINNQRAFLPSTTANCSMSMTNITTLPPTTPAFMMASTMAPDVSPLHKFYSISYLWYSCFSVLFAFVVGFVVSLLTRGMRGKPVAAKLIHPWVRNFYKDLVYDEDDKDSIVKPTQHGLETNYYVKSVENGKVGGIDNLGADNVDGIDNLGADIVVTRM